MDLKPEIDFLNERDNAIKKYTDSLKERTQGEIVRNAPKLIENILGIFDYIINTDSSIIQRLENKEAEIEMPKLPELPPIDKNISIVIPRQPSSSIEFHKNIPQEDYYIQEQEYQKTIEPKNKIIELIKQHKVISVILGIIILLVIYFSFLTTPEPTSYVKWLDFTP